MSDARYRKETYGFELPEELIASRPSTRRDASRLLFLPAGAAAPTHHTFRDLPELLQPNDVLVLNDTRVIPARLSAHKPTGGHVEVLLCRRGDEADTAVCLLRPAKKMKPGLALHFGDDAEAEVLYPMENEPGSFLLRFNKDPYVLALDAGEIPLPPYMNRAADARDDDDYQTVFAQDGIGQAAAAPTAGLHFTDELFAALADKGIERVHVTLHVGPGTFFPVRTDDIRDHDMHAEPWFLSQDAADRLNQAKQDGRRLVAVGTTSVRVLESACGDDGQFKAGSGLTRIFISPGYSFRATDALITNFHLPESTLMMLVSALAGTERILDAYGSAVAERYRFFSYGDACLLEREPHTESETENHNDI